MSREGDIARWKIVVFSLIPVLVLFALVELGLRVYVHRQAELDRGKALPTPAQRNIYQRPDPVLGYGLTPGYDAGGIRVNALGFRGPDIVVPKPSGTFRIVAIGDSTTFGLAGEACPYAAQLQALLLGRGSDRRFEVVNAGVEGYGSDYALRLLETRIGRLQPDVVILFIGWNDLYSTNPFVPNVPRLHEDLQEARRLTRHNAATSGWWIVDSLYTLQFVRRVAYLDLPRFRARFATAAPARTVGVHPAMIRVYSNYLTRLARRTRDLGAIPVFVTLPSVLSANMSSEGLKIVHYPPWARSDYRLFLQVVDEFNHTIRETSRQERAPLVDAAAVYDQLGLAKEKLFFDACHMYCAGHGLLARTFRDELSRQRAIP